MRFYVMQWLATRFYGSLSVYSQPLRSDSQRSKRFRLVSEQRNTEEGDFRFWPREKWNESQKVKEGGGGGEERKETLADKPLDFENLRSPANAAPDWLG